MKNTTQAMSVEIPAMAIQKIDLIIIGDSPLIMHKWSEKAKKEMLDKQMKVAKPGREAKDPERDYEESIYRFSDGRYGFPAVAFKAAAVRAGKTIGMVMTDLRQAFHVDSELVEITGEPSMREDMVRVGSGTADIRYRAEFVEWTASIPIKFNTNAISASQIANLFNVAGFGVGIGEWRPEKNGQYGRFHVQTEDK